MNTFKFKLGYGHTGTNMEGFKQVIDKFKTEEFKPTDLSYFSTTSSFIFNVEINAENEFEAWTMINELTNRIANDNIKLDAIHLS